MFKKQKTGETISASQTSQQQIPQTTTPGNKEG